MTTAFVLSGGGSLGAVQVGMLQALAARGIVPDLLVGTSAGAMNAAWVGVHGMSEESLAGLAGVWTRLRRADVMPFDARLALRGVLGRRPAVGSAARLGRLVATHAPGARLEEASVPLHVVTADLLSGRTVTLTTGALVTAVLASAAVPGVFPPVRYDGRWLVDGAVAEHTGLRHAVESGVDDIYVLPAGSPCALPDAPGSAVGTAMHALTLLLEQRLAHEMVDLDGRASIRVLPPLCPLSVSAVDFSHGAELVARSRDASLRWIEAGALEQPDPGRFLTLHHHRDVSPPAQEAPAPGS